MTRETTGTTGTDGVGTGTDGAGWQGVQGSWQEVGAGSGDDLVGAGADLGGDADVALTNEAVVFQLGNLSVSEMDGFQGELLALTKKWGLEVRWQ